MRTPAGLRNEARRSHRALLVFALVFGWAASAAAPAHAGEVPDHLACRELGGSDLARARVTVQSGIDGAGERACKLKKAAYLCSPAARISTVPFPPLDVVDGAELPGDFLCYRTRCRNDTGPRLVTDAFGERTVKLKRSRLVCVPASLGDHL
jgi:hypothetical protein